jgi:hypothetical protein
VFSNFSITGNDSPFSDDFTTDAALNTGLWKILAANTTMLVYFYEAGTWTLTGADISNNNIISNTSSSISVQ